MARFGYLSIMARRPRVEFPGALYHVISRGNHGQNVFRAPADYGRYGHLLERYQTRYGFLLYAYVLMPTHVHLLLETGAIPLSKIMQGLQQSYTLYFNRRYQVSGHLFQGRYNALLCQKDAYLLELVRYLHLNPVRARLVQTPEGYRWSSHRVYLAGESGGGVTVTPVLARFSRTRAQAVREYRRFIRAGRRQGQRPDLYRATEQRYLGDEAFITQIERQRPEREPPRPVQIPLPDVAAAVSRATGVALDLITAASRHRAAARARALIAYLAREVGGIPLTTTAHYLGRDQATLSIGLRKLGDQQAADPALRALIGRLSEVLRRGRRVKYKIINV